MTDRTDDVAAAAIARESLIVRTIALSAATIAHAWETSSVRRLVRPAHAALGALTARDRLRYGLVVVAAAVVTRLLLLAL
jgi:hypothetical protein